MIMILLIIFKNVIKDMDTMMDITLLIKVGLKPIARISTIHQIDTDFISNKIINSEVQVLQLLND